VADLICYCFNYTDEDIELELRQDGKSSIIQKILAESAWVDASARQRIPRAANV
jgi:hypothetical protein